MIMYLSQSRPFHNLHILLTYAVPPQHSKAYFMKTDVDLDVMTNNEYIT